MYRGYLNAKIDKKYYKIILSFKKFVYKSYCKLFDVKWNFIENIVRFGSILKKYISPIFSYPCILIKK